MDATLDKSKTFYLEDAERFAKQTAPKRISCLRHAGLRLFGDSTLPHAKMESWRHTHIASLLHAPYPAHIAGKMAPIPPLPVPARIFDVPASARLVFVDGSFCPELSSSPNPGEGEVWAGNLAAAMRGPHGPRLEKILRPYPVTRNPFSALNSAFLNEGAYVFIPRSVQLHAPIHLIYLTGQRPAHTAAYVRSVIVAEPESNADVLIHHDVLEGVQEYFNNIVQEICLSEDARINVLETMREGNSGHRLSSCRVDLEEGAQFRSMAVSLKGGALSRNEHEVTMSGKGALACLEGLSLISDRGVLDNDLHLLHKAPACVSRIGYRGISTGHSRSVFTGLIHVAHEAQKTDSEQLSANLLLSDTARVDTKPQLEIYADDVRCTHGATVGGPPDAAVFYLRSRGMDEKAARGMLAYGFAEEMIMKINHDAYREWLQGRLFEAFGSTC